MDCPDLRLQLREAFGERFAPGDNGLIGTVAPQDAAELRKLILCTRESGVPLVPRGAGTSPFGGAKASEGVVLSFERLNRVVQVNARAELVRVEPGVVWRQLIDQLRSRGLMPRVYPSSAASSTVGGFVAQGAWGSAAFSTAASATACNLFA